MSTTTSHDAQLLDALRRRYDAGEELRYLFFLGFALMQARDQTPSGSA